MKCEDDLESDIRGIEQCMNFTHYKYPCNNEHCKNRKYCPLVFGGVITKLLPKHIQKIRENERRKILKEEERDWKKGEKQRNKEWNKIYETYIEEGKFLALANFEKLSKKLDNVLKEEWEWIDIEDVQREWKQLKSELAKWKKENSK